MNYNTEQLATIHNVATHALENIRQRGWIKKSLQTDEGVCIEGAAQFNLPGQTRIGNSNVYSGNNFSDVMLFRRYASNKLGGRGLPTWNDRRWRKEHHVINLLEDIIEETRPYAEEMEAGRELSKISQEEQVDEKVLTTA